MKKSVWLTIKTIVCVSAICLLATLPLTLACSAAVGATRNQSELTNNTWYFAEGTTREGYDEWITIQNPGEAKAHVTITFMMADGYNQDFTLDVAPTSRTTLSVRSIVGSGRDVSAKVTSDRPVVVERPMYFNYQGAWPGGQCALGATAQSTEWYFAEGSTRPGFEEYLCFQNPGDNPASIHIDYMTSNPVNFFQDLLIAPRSRVTVKVSDTVPPGEDVSAKVKSSQPIVAERPMYYIFNGGIPGGDDVVGVPAPQKSWYFAEGYTSSNFWTYVCIQNPGDAASATRVYYLMADGRVLFNEMHIAPKSRITIDARQDVGNAEFSIVVDSDHAVVAERPMYFVYQNKWSGGHDVMGATAPGNELYFAEGTTIGGFDEWMCIMNPNNDPAHVTFQIQVEGSAPLTTGYTIAAHSRYTVNINDTVGPGKNVSVKATSDLPVVAERPMYFNYQGKWPGGHCVVGFMP